MLNVFLIAAASAIVSGAAQAHGMGASAAEPAGVGAPGGATPISATPLYSGRRYQGTIDKKGQEIWYQFYAGYKERALFELSGRTRSCPIRATLLDGVGKKLAQIISSSSEVEPFLVVVPSIPGLNLYRLQIDADPYVSCAKGSYSVSMIEPFSEPPERPLPPPPPPQPLPPPQPPEPVAGYSTEPPRAASGGVLDFIESRPSYQNARCNSAGLAYRRAKDEAEQASRGHRKTTSRRLEGRKRVAFREMLKYCPGVT
jgi:hypothetical protein